MLRKIIATIIDDLLSMESSTVAYAAGSFVLRDEHHAKGFVQKIVACTSTSTTHLLAHQK